METVSIDITRALAIDGWMTEPELVWLAEQAREHSVIVEIGSYLGRSTRAMLDHTQGTMHVFDDFKGPREVYLTKEERKDILERFLDNVEYIKNTDRLWLWRGDHSEATTVNLTPDMVFLDGGHEYEDVKRDIKTWLPKLKKGGLLCGHDYGAYIGVTEAVDELLGTVQVAPNTTIWYTKA